MENNKITLTKPLLSKLAAVFEASLEVLSGYLFGSTATGHRRKASDVDVAVRLAPGLSAEERFRIRLELIGRIEKLIERSADVVLMNDAGLIMINQILSNGIPVFVRDVQDEEHFKLLKQKEFFDFRYYIDRDFEQMKRYFGVSARDGK